MNEYDARDLPGPTRDADVWSALGRWRAERRTFVLATVVESRGFTPRKPGSNWSQLNREMAKRLLDAGRVHESGRKVLPADL